MNLQPGKTYQLSAARNASVVINSTIGSSPTPTPSATPRPTPTQSVWIAVRNDGIAGSGTLGDPYDGSTQLKFDAIMSNLQGMGDLTVNLGAGTFRTSVNKSWVIKPGWVVAGAGMYDTTIQLSGTVTGFHGGASCLWSDANIATNNVVIRDLTCDANWDELGPTADPGAGARSVTDGVISILSPVIISATGNFSPADYSRTLTGAGIPAGSTIKTRNMRPFLQTPPQMRVASPSWSAEKRMSRQAHWLCGAATISLNVCARFIPMVQQQTYRSSL
jgi:hypothetical protein